LLELGLLMLLAQTCYRLTFALQQLLAAWHNQLQQTLSS
jgi:hypothetical protein